MRTRDAGRAAGAARAGATNSCHTYTTYRYMHARRSAAHPSAPVARRSSGGSGKELSSQLERGGCMHGSGDGVRLAG